MNLTRIPLFLCLLLVSSSSPAQTASSLQPTPAQTSGFADAAQFGFSPAASGVENTHALQKAVDQTGTIIVSQPGTYKIAGTVYLGSNTSLVFGNNVFLKKSRRTGRLLASAAQQGK